MYRLVLTISALAVFALAVPPVDAVAAEGKFTYTLPPAEGHIKDPDIRCYPYTEGSGPVENQTDVQAELYGTPNCSGVPSYVPPRGRRPHETFRSVRFNGIGPAFGIFIYLKPGERRTLENPTSERCFNIKGSGYVHNETDEVVLLYRRAGCVGAAASRVNRNGHVFHADFSSLEFVSD
ncbi:hypothetical protein FRZ03_28650 [Streptomyces misionensis]|uniref:Secreted protein n=1 Tax=Streptomyces misionensis TaxID=67331 RepID=A0A5C6IYW8_9ACTN|nr:hypothetical protein [Streptomyces misionensis]TWV34388.1 hypothetical protein FRZ03_28650 [Streptomyces misionensis]